MSNSEQQVPGVVSCAGPISNMIEDSEQAKNAFSLIEVAPPSGACKRYPRLPSYINVLSLHAIPNDPLAGLVSPISGAH
jgi:hypothetical protein